jgi:hypothetical protein
MNKCRWCNAWYGVNDLHFCSKERNRPLHAFYNLTVETTEETMSDQVNNPKHYTDGKIEVIDFIEDKKLGFHLGNVVKYVARAGKKDPDKVLEDLRKAEWYLKRYIEMLSDRDWDPHILLSDTQKAEEARRRLRDYQNKGR